MFPASSVRWTYIPISLTAKRDMKSALFLPRAVFPGSMLALNVQDTLVDSLLKSNFASAVIPEFLRYVVAASLVSAQIMGFLSALLKLPFLS